jgi:hypothetical protein
MAKRVGKANPDKGRLILVSCDSHWDKRKLYEARTTLKENGYPNTFINEDLTPKQGELFFHSRQAKRKGLLKTTWTENGIVHVKLPDCDQAIILSSLERLHELVPQYSATS